MDFEEIKKLIELVKDTGIGELEVQQGDNRVRIRGGGVSAPQDIVLPAVLPVSVSGSAVTSATLAAPQQPVPPAPQPTAAEDDRNEVVKSPIVGTYYDAPAPGAAVFVKVGDQVHPKQVLCIIESMKLMNEIEAEIAGTVVAKLVENGRPVEYGESLFLIRPL